MSTEVEAWLGEYCPILNSLRNNKKPWPEGFRIFACAPSVEEIVARNPILEDFPKDELIAHCAEVAQSQMEQGRQLLLELESAIEELSRNTGGPVNKKFEALVRAASTENKVVELLTEVNVVNALCRILANPELSPETHAPKAGSKQGKNCDLYGELEGHKLWIEIKTYEDNFPREGLQRGRAMSERGFHSARQDGKDVRRARASELRSKLTGQTKVGEPPSGVPEQLKPGEINICLVNERGWSLGHLAAACLGDNFVMNVPSDPHVAPCSITNGLFAEERWRRVAGVAQVRKDGSSIRLTWFLNPNAEVPIPQSVLERLQREFG